jgi:hypothetical protein
MSSPDGQAPAAARYSTPFTRSDYRPVLITWLLVYIATPFVILFYLPGFQSSGSGTPSGASNRISVGNLGAIMLWVTLYYSYIAAAVPFVLGGFVNALAVAGMRRLAARVSRPAVMLAGLVTGGILGYGVALWTNVILRAPCGAGCTMGTPAWYPLPVAGLLGLVGLLAAHRSYAIAQRLNSAR